MQKKFSKTMNGSHCISEFLLEKKSLHEILESLGPRLEEKVQEVQTQTWDPAFKSGVELGYHRAVIWLKRILADELDAPRGTPRPTGLLSCPRCGRGGRGWSSGRTINGEALANDKRIWVWVYDHPPDSAWVCYDCAVELKVRKP